MTKRSTLLHRFHADKSGATAIEYAMIASVIALALVLCLPGFSAAVGGLFTAVLNALS